MQWAKPHRFADLPLWTPERGLETIDLLATYSMEGPQHLELVQALDSGFYQLPSEPGPHHEGVWVDDLPASIEQLQSRGWTIAAAGGPPDEAYGLFAYLQHPQSRLLLELVSTQLRPAFEDWWAGGSLD